MLVFIYQKRQLQLLSEKEQLKLSYDKEILESKLEIQEQTLKKISQEIHDNIGQVLSLAKLTINTISCNDPDDLRDKIFNSSQLIGKALQDLRDLSRSFHTDHITEIGLVAAIENELNLLAKTGNYKTVLKQEGEIDCLSHQNQLILFRIFQELLNNIIKHSLASHIEVYLNYNPPSFIFQILDNGKGFKTSNISENLNANQGLGITNIRNRAKVMGADFNIYSEPDKGTNVQIILPV